MFSSDLAIDLGTANTLVYAAGKGIVVKNLHRRHQQEHRRSGGCRQRSQEMLGRTPGNIVAISP